MLMIKHEIVKINQISSEINPESSSYSVGNSVCENTVTKWINI